MKFLSHYTVFDTNGKVVFKGDGRISDYYVKGVVAINTGSADTSGALSQYAGQLEKGAMFDINGNKLTAFGDYSYKCNGTEYTPFAGGEVNYFWNPLYTGKDLNDDLTYDDAEVFALPHVNSNAGVSMVYYTPNGTKLFTEALDSIDDMCAYMFKDGYAVYVDTESGLCGAMDRYGKKITPAKYADMSYCFGGHFAVIDPNTNLQGVIDINGKTVFPCSYEYASVGDNDVVLKKNGQFGLSDYNGKEILPFAYEFLTNSTAGVSAYGGNGKYGFIQLDGTKLTDAVYSDGHIMEDGQIIAVDASGFYCMKYVKAAQKTAYAGTTTVLIDGKSVTLNLYALKDINGNGTNYIKLRDIAYVLNGSVAQFDVGWNDSIVLKTHTAYTSQNGTEMVSSFNGDQPYEDCASAITVDGNTANMQAITLTDATGGGHNYFKLRDVGKNLGFNVSWDSSAGKIIINTNEAYSDAA